MTSTSTPTRQYHRYLLEDTLTPHRTLPAALARGPAPTGGSFAPRLTEESGWLAGFWTAVQHHSSIKGTSTAHSSPPSRTLPTTSALSVAHASTTLRETSATPWHSPPRQRARQVCTTAVPNNQVAAFHSVTINNHRLLTTPCQIASARPSA